MDKKLYRMIHCSSQSHQDERRSDRVGLGDGWDHSACCEIHRESIKNYVKNVLNGYGLMNFQIQKYSCFQWDKKEESNAQIDKFLIIVKWYA